MNDRKVFLRGLLIAAALLPALLRADDYDIMRDRWKLLILGPSPAGTTDDPMKSAVTKCNSDALHCLHGINATGQEFIPPMEPAPFSLGYIWSDLQLPAPGVADGNSSANLTATYSRLEKMVRAYATDSTGILPKSSLYHTTADGKDMGKAFLAALEYLHEHYYNNQLEVVFAAPPAGGATPEHPGLGGATFYRRDAQGNHLNTPSTELSFYDYQISIPSSINNIATMLYDLDSDALGVPIDISTEVGHNLTDAAYFLPAVYETFTSANLFWASRNLIVHSVLLKDSAGLSGGLNSLIGSNSTTPLAIQLNRQSLFTPVTVGDGYYADGSFVQHYKHPLPRANGGLPYAGGYGSDLIVGLTDLFYMLQGSTNAAFSSIVAAQQNCVDGLLQDTYAPVIFKGEMMDLERGRYISRWNATSHGAGHQTLAAFIHAAKLYPTLASKYQSAVKYWLNSDTTLPTTPFLNPYSGFGLQDIIWAEEIMNPAVIAGALTPTGYFAFPATDRAVHLETDWAAGLAMHSTRIANYESVGQENLKGWNTAAGMLYLYNVDQLQFSKGFWATVDPFRLPGITAANGYKPQDAQISQMNFVGALENFSHSRGMAAMEIGPSGSSGTSFVYNEAVDNTAKVHRLGTDYTSTSDGDQYGRKSWFFFPDKIVALGAGLIDQNSAGGNYHLETTVENRKLTTSGTNLLRINYSGLAPAGAVLTDAPAVTPSPTTLTNVVYAHLSGTDTPGTGTAKTRGDIGYYFPVPATLLAKREKRDGYWADVNHGAIRVQETAETTVTANYLTLWYDHGIQPGGSDGTAATAGSYAYIVLPNIEPADLATYALHPDITVLENSTEAQAVRQIAEDAVHSVHTAAVFWQRANGAPTNQTSQWSTKTIAPGYGSVTSSGNALVFLSEYDSGDGRTMKITVADPTQPAASSNPAQIVVTINKATSTTTDTLVDGIKVTSSNPIILSVAAGSNGLGHGITLPLLISRFECETLNPQGNGGVTPQIVSDSKLSGGSGVLYSPPSAPDGSQSVDFTFTLPAGGNWRIRVGHRTTADSGIYSAILPQANDHILKSGVDLYSASTSYSETDLGVYNFDSSGTKTLRFKPTGKNPASSGYALTFDYIILAQY